MKPIHIELFGSYGATHAASKASIDFSNRKAPKDPLGPLCRRLLALDFDPESPVHVTRNGTPVFKRDRKLSNWAGEDISDSINKVAHRTPYRPFGPPLGHSSASGGSVE